MPIAEDNVRIQAIIHKNTSEKINELSKVLNLSHSKTIAFLLEGAVEDSEWVIRLVNHRFVHNVLTALGVSPGRYAKSVATLPELEESVSDQKVPGDK